MMNNNYTNKHMTVLERQRACYQWQQQQQQLESCFGHGGLSEVVARSISKPDPGFISNNNNWPDFLGFGACFDVNYFISRTSSCPPSVAAAEMAAVAVKGGDLVVKEKISSSGVAGKESSKKRNIDKANVEEDIRDKRLKATIEVNDSKTKPKGNKVNNNNKESSSETSKDNNSKVTEVQKPDYIHVRARRGQATDSHSLAERARREKISERMKYLQSLVPGCNKITGKAGMLDEIINYVQSLQRQVEFLSMKLAAVNPRLDFNVDDLIAKEVFPACAANFPQNGMSSDITNSPFVQINQVQQELGLNMTMNNSRDVGLKRTISAPPDTFLETFFDSTCFNQSQQSSAWDVDLTNLYNLTSFPSQSFTDSLETRNLKMEM